MRESGVGSREEKQGNKEAIKRQSATSHSPTANYQLPITDYQSQLRDSAGFAPNFPRYL